MLREKTDRQTELGLGAFDDIWPGNGSILLTLESTRATHNKALSEGHFPFPVRAIV